MTIKVPVSENGTINTTAPSSENSTMTVEPEEEKNSTTVEDVPAIPLGQKDLVPKDKSIKPKRKASTSADLGHDSFMDKLKSEKKKLDL